MPRFQVPTFFTAKDGLSRPFKTMQRNAKNFGRSVVNSVQRADRSLGFLNRRLAKTVALAGALTLAFGVRGGAQSFLELDKSMSAASAKFGIFDRNAKVFKDIRNTALEMGATTEFTAGQAAEGLKNLATAGFSANQAIAGIPKILDLATATQQDLAIASDVAAKTLSAFGLRSKDPKELNKNLGLVSDTLNKLITTSGFGDLQQFLDVISQSGSTARGAGVDITTWGAAVATSVSEAVPASKAGTRFANMLSFMSKNLKAFTKQGIAVEDANGNFRDFIEIMKDVERKTANLGEVKRASFLFKLFGDRGAKMAAQLLDNGIPALEAYRTEIRKANGLTQRMAEFMRSGLTGGVNAAKSAFEAIAIAVGDTFQPEIDQAIKDMTNAARATKVWIGENRELIKVVFGLVKMLIKAFLIFKTIVLIVKVATIAYKAYSIVLGITTAALGRSAFAVRGNVIAMKANIIATKAATVATRLFNLALRANPIGLIITAIIALGVVIFKMVKNWEDWGAAMSLALGPLGSLISMIMSFRRNWESISKAFKSGGMINGIKAIGLAITDAFLQPFQQLARLIKNFTGVDFLNIERNITAARGLVARGIDILAEGGPTEGTTGTSVVNPEAATQRAFVERSESVERNQLDVNINDPGGFASVNDEGVGEDVSVNVQSTFGFN